jgi:hypothetical protein
MLLRLALTGFLALSIAGCSKKMGEAIVVTKEHIDAREPNTSSPSPSDSPVKEESEIREMAPDEIDADGFVMKKDVRGTSKDPRASTEEQWRVTVEIVNVGRTIVVRTDRAHFDKLKNGDRVRVRYKEGNYTGTVWDADFVD